MPAKFRDLWLVLHAKGMADRVLDRFKRDIKDIGDESRLAGLLAEKASKEAELAQRKYMETIQKTELAQMQNVAAARQQNEAYEKMKVALEKNEVALLQNEKSALRTEIAIAKLNRANRQVIRNLERQIVRIDQQINEKRADILTTERLVNVMREHNRELDEAILLKKSDILTTRRRTEELKKSIKDIDVDIKAIRVEQAAEKLAPSFWKRLFTPNPKVLSALRTGIPGALASPVGVAALTLGALWAWSFVTAALGVIGSGALGLGIAAAGAIALRESEKLKTHLEGTANFLSKAFAKIAQPLEERFIGALEMIRTAAKERVFPELAKIFLGIRPIINSTAAMVTSFAEALLKPIAEPRALEGLRRFFVAIQPDVRRLGDAIGRFFKTIMENGPLFAEAFSIIVSIVDNFLKVLAGLLVHGAGMLKAFAAVWNFIWQGLKDEVEPIIEFLDRLEKIWGGTEKKIKSVGGAVNDIDPELQDLMDALAGLADRSINLNSELGNTSRKLDEVTVKSQSLFDKWMSVESSSARLSETILGLAERLDKNGRKLDENTVAGAKNRSMILDSVEAAEAHRKKMIESGLSVAFANAKTLENIEAIKEQALQAGIDADALQKLLDKYLALYKAPNIHKVIKLEGQKVGSDQVFKIAGTNVKFFAQGGRTPVNKPFWVGENGPELMMLSRPGQVFSHEESKQLMRQMSGQGSGGGKTITIHQTINVQEIDPRLHAAQLGWELAGRL